MKRVIVASDNLAERIEDELYVLMDSNDGASEVRGIKTGNFYDLEESPATGGYVICYVDEDGSEKILDFEYLSQVANWLIQH